jgi:hypothetical protein
MNWQWLAVGISVTLASLYLARQSWRTWSGRKSGCGSCSCASKTAVPKTAGMATFIPSSELMVRSRRN